MSPSSSLLLLLLCCACHLTYAGTVVSSPKANVISGRSMVYFVHRGMEVAKPDNSLYQRIKRSVWGPGESLDKPIIDSLNIISNITSRFATTLVTSEMTNPSDDDREATFRMMLPETAFMSNFTMLIDGEVYVAEVKSKEEAEEAYEEAQEQNRTAGLVESEVWQPEEEVRGMERFKVSVNIARNSSIVFQLTYMELLQRRGLYQQRISVRPNQVVRDLEVVVLIFEAQGISGVDIMEPGSNSVVPQHTSVTHMVNDVVAEIRYNPSENTQKQASKEDQVGLKGDFVVSYDVVHSNDAGLIQVEDNYFVHYFSPPADQLEPLPKNVVFVIDISGSMSGDKIAQTRQAMMEILDQLRPTDSFLILLFDDEQEFWPSRDTRLVAASADKINAAKNYVEAAVRADGGTNINDALVKGAEFLNTVGEYGANMIVFLTDGDPTSGVTSTEDILANVARATAGKVSIFSLGFGMNMNFDLLRAISFRNGGFAQRIYADVDAEVQLKDFFDSINTPLLFDVRVDYGEWEISLTQTNFAQYFQGSEIIIAGKFESVVPEEFDVAISGKSSAPVSYDQHVICDLSLVVPPEAAPIFSPGGFERLYVYMKIRDQLRRVLMTDSETEKASLEEFALQMALEYHLVTPLTSFIIVQNDAAPRDDQEMYYDMGMAMSPASTNVRYAFSGAVTLSCVASFLGMWLGSLALPFAFTE